MKTSINKSFLSTLLVFSILFSSLAFTVPANAAITRSNVTKIVKWGTIAGVAVGAVIGAATLGIGGLILGAGVGALVSTFVSSRLGVSPSEQYKIVFPNGIFPFNRYKRSTQTIGTGSSLPSASQILSVDNMNKTAMSIKNKYNATKAKFSNSIKNVITSKDKTANTIKQKYQTSYTKYINAVNRGKNTPAVKKAREVYLKSKIKFMGLFKK